MERLPTDLWLHIFQTACTDGGRTGAALALTSRAFRALSASCRFHSLKLHSLAQIGQLLLCLERVHRCPTADSRTGHAPAAPERGPLRTHHLLLSFLPDTCDAPLRPWRGWTAYSKRKPKQRGQVEADGRGWEESKAAWDRQFVYLVPRLFELVAPSLETLAVLQCTEIALPYVRAVFPVLRELSLLADDRIFVRPDAVWTSTALSSGEPSEDAVPEEASGGPPFPVLSHLHVVYQGPKLHPWEKTLPLWGELAPSVTHLRVSQASKLIPEVLELVSRHYQHMHNTSRMPPRVAFPNLQRAIVQPFVPEPVRGHEHVEEVERRSSARTQRGGPQIVVMRGRWYRNGYWMDRLRWEWEGRMLGAPGCWSEREEDEGEWAFERRKRMEMAQIQAQRKVSGHSIAERVVSVIRLDKIHEGPPRRTWRSWAGLAQERSASA